MKISKYIVMFSMIFVLGACESDDNNDVFDKNPIERLNEIKVELKNNLVSSENGWSMTFFPSNKLMGGYSFWFEFKEDGSLLTRSDIDSDLSIHNEEYDFVMLSSLALSFPTGATIHEFITKNPEKNKTDIEFLFEDYQGDDIVFKGHTTRNEIRMTRATVDDKKFDLTKRHRNLDVVATKRNLSVVEGAEVYSFTVAYNKNSRYATVKSTAGSINENGGIGIGATNSGIIISPAIEFEDGSSLSELALDGNRFVGEVNGNMVILQ